jgi:hypothetical protein
MQLKLAHNPLRVSGLVPGPWLHGLTHLDLHATRMAYLPAWLTRATSLCNLSLACCHDLTLDRDVVERVVGRIKGLEVGWVQHAVCTLGHILNVPLSFFFLCPPALPLIDALVVFCDCRLSVSVVR